MKRDPHLLLKLSETKFALIEAKFAHFRLQYENPTRSYQTLSSVNTS